jgi:ketosteroid isomerase-like protein
VPEDEIKVLQQIYRAVQQGDWDDLQSLLTHDIEWILPETLPWGGTHHGHLGILAVAEGYAEHIDRFWADPDEYFESEEGIVVLGRLSGTAHSSGQEFEVAFAHVWRMDEGVPTSLRAYFDTGPIMDALDA